MYLSCLLPLLNLIIFFFLLLVSMQCTELLKYAIIYFVHGIFYRCQALRDEAYSALGEHCHNLQEAYFDNCYALSDASLQAVSINRINVILLLNLRQSTQIKLIKPYFFIQHLFIFQIGGGCPKLRVLSLNHCNMITDKGISAVAKGCPHLIELQTDDCKKVSQVHFIFKSIKCKEKRV